MALLLAKTLQPSIMLVEEAVLSLHVLDTMLVQIRQLFRGFDVVHVLDMTLGEDQVDLFQRALCRLWVVNVDKR